MTAARVEQAACHVLVSVGLTCDAVNEPWGAPVWAGESDPTRYYAQHQGFDLARLGPTPEAAAADLHDAIRATCLDIARKRVCPVLDLDGEVNAEARTAIGGSPVYRQRGEGFLPVAAGIVRRSGARPRVWDAKVYGFTGFLTGQPTAHACAWRLLALVADRALKVAEGQPLEMHALPGSALDWPAVKDKLQRRDMALAAL